MAITPRGDPAWVKSSDYTTYGGNQNKTNYQAQGAVDGRTDVDAADFARISDDLASMHRTADFASFTVTCNDSSPAAPTITNYDAMAGSAPTGARNGNGDVTLTFSASYTDAYGVSGLLNISGAKFGLQGTTAGTVTYVLSDPDANGLNERIQLLAKDSSGTPISDAVFTVEIETASV